MSYSRWSHSRWYTFHHVESGDSLEDQLFAIYDTVGCARCYAYEDLDGITIPELAQLCAPYSVEPTMKELAELLRYVEAWLSDMREDFPAA